VGLVSEELMEALAECAAEGLGEPTFEQPNP
jgi:hypothetical protein